MKVLTINHSDINGGAARAAYRLHCALRTSGVDSRMWVNKMSTDDWTVEGPANNFEEVVSHLRALSIRPVLRTLKTGNPILHSPQFLSSALVHRINSSDADVAHLHWVQGEMLSVKDIGRITKPIVWTLHDMWAFCGAEHYTEDDRWREGYLSDNRPMHEAGLDLNRWTWSRKRKHWQTPMQIVTPSHWLTECVRQSALMRDRPAVTIFNPIDIERWKPIPRASARELLGLPTQVPLLLFGAMGGGRDPRKGFDLLQSTLKALRNVPEAKGIELVIFGQLAPKVPPELGFPIHYTGHLHDDLSLRALYSSANMMIIPSRQDNLPNAGVEALACGTPVVAFNICGLPDIVRHAQTGYLANAFDTEDLAQMILQVLKHPSPDELSQNARQHAVADFDSRNVASKYIQLYEEVLHSKSKKI